MIQIKDKKDVVDATLVGMYAPKVVSHLRLTMKDSGILK